MDIHVCVYVMVLVMKKKENEISLMKCSYGASRFEVRLKKKKKKTPPEIVCQVTNKFLR